MAKTLFISPVKLKEQYIIDNNVDDRILNACIYNAQDYYIKRVIGTDLYNRIVNEINSGVGADIKNLLDNYIENALIHYAMVEVYNYLTYRATARGVIQKEADGSSSLDYDVIDKLRKEELGKANVYADTLRRFIMENPTKYPEFNSNADLSDFRPTSSFTKIGYGYGRRINYNYLNDSDIGYYSCY